MTVRFVTYRPSKGKSELDILDRAEDLLSWKEYGRIEGWSARKNFRPGDLALFYMARPLMSIVGLGLVDSEPYYGEADNPADFKNPVFCDFKPVWFLDTFAPIKEAVQRQELQTWWGTCPYRSIRRIESSVAEALMQEILDVNQSLGQELEKLGWNASKPLDFSVVYSRGKAYRISARKSQWDLEDLPDLTPSDFEHLVGEVFRLKDTGSQVELTPKTGDYGVDIVVIRGRLLRKREVVQCKRYRPEVKVSTPDMLQFVGSMKKFGVEKGYFVTTSTFSRYAAKVAEDTEPSCYKHF